MRSSIFSSKPRNANQAIVLLLSGLLIYLGALELVTSAAMKRVGRGTRRVYEDYSRTLTLRPSTPEGRQTVLVVGNSLLLAGVERERLAAEMSPDYSVTLWPVENTTYLDWYFGLRRVFAEGARPSVVVLCLSPRQLLASSVTGESFAHRMMLLRDVFAVTKAADLDTTTASAFFFANMSSWLGDRSSVRNRILETWLPHASRLTSSLAPPSPPETDRNSRLAARAAERLRDLEDLVSANGARFVFVVPPLLSEAQLAGQISLAASQDNVKLLMPYPPGEMSEDHFFDGFHLNTNGAHVFTQRLAPLLQASLR